MWTRAVPPRSQQVGRNTAVRLRVEKDHPTARCRLQRSKRSVGMDGCHVLQAVYNLLEAHKKKKVWNEFFACPGDGLAKLVAVSSLEAFSVSQDPRVSRFETFSCRLRRLKIRSAWQV